MVKYLIIKIHKKLNKMNSETSCLKVKIDTFCGVLYKVVQIHTRESVTGCGEN
jgi:hypothetical protein